MTKPFRHRTTKRRAHSTNSGPLHGANRIRAARRQVQGVDAAMQRGCTYAHPAGRIIRIETHISIVYLAGRFAYKIIKPVAPGFADFTAPEARRGCCEAQVRLNRPLAQGLYLGVLPIKRRGRTLTLESGGRTVEHAVKMRRFDESGLFSSLARSGALSPHDVDRAAHRLAAWHRHAPRDAPLARYGSAALLKAQVDAVNASLQAGCNEPALREIAAWCKQQLAQRAGAINRRRADGFVRACHGDLHLDNVMRWRGEVSMFDCIDFDDALRWIDIANDIAFLVMDLRARAGTRLSNRLLNRWLEATGDYAALDLMPLYVAYRALVRALVAYLYSKNGLHPKAAAAARDAARYMDIAAAESKNPPPVLLLCHGFSGSGKSVASQALAESSGAVCLSSDVERKRLESTPAATTRLDATHYTQVARHAVYNHLIGLATSVLQAGYSVIVDATFLERRHRSAFFSLGERLGVPTRVLDFHAAPDILAERIVTRQRNRRDASDADTSTLSLQLATAEPLTSAETAQTFAFDTNVPVQTFDDPAFWKPVLDLMSSPVTESASFTCRIRCKSENNRCAAEQDSRRPRSASAGRQPRSHDDAQ
ncbi:bifunctional aminoglycoside phosphotransferase/ATP-binding protein [Paraburkholderia caribensis]|uniref:bifunctional aminoglycoside phosphotransferase/ATP-binding protein n=1 Tax=Paraburkholderia caribensis TaxID=75105 RepID=UPI001590EEE8